MAEPRLITVTEAAEELGVTSQRVGQMIRRGQLKAQKVGPIWLIKTEDLEAVRVRPLGRPPTKRKTKAKG